MTDSSKAPFIGIFPDPPTPQKLALHCHIYVHWASDSENARGKGQSLQLSQKYKINLLCGKVLPTPQKIRRKKDTEVLLL